MMADVDGGSRFELLVGRFCDGTLTESEDRELVAMLENNTQLARRFVQQARMERLIAGTTGEQRSETEFRSAVLRSLELLQDESQTQQFADSVVQLVKARPSYRGPKRISLKRKPADGSRLPLWDKTQFSSWIALSGAAILVLAVLIGLTRSSTPSQQAGGGTPGKIGVQRVDLEAPKIVENDGELPAPLTPTALPEASGASIIAEAPKETPTRPPSRELRAPVVGVNPPQQIVTPPPLPGARRTMATLANLSGSKALIKRDGREIVLAAGATCFAGDVLRVAPSDASPGEIATSTQGQKLRFVPGLELTLQDGTLLWLKLGSAISFQDENGVCRPLLENGELLARVTPQSAGVLIVRTRQGPETAVLGTVFRLTADTHAKRVTLRVEEGRVLFSNQGVKRIVNPDEACVAEDGKEPGAILYFRPRPASVTGVVIDKETGKPLANAGVSVVPMAERAVKEKRVTIKTDALGQYAFDALPEGWAYLFVRTEEGKSAGLMGRGTVTRIKLIGGEKLNTNVVLDKAILVAGRASEQGAKPLTDFTVKFNPANGDGRIVDYELNSRQLLPNEYRAIVFEGPGRYTALLEKQGFVARVKSIKVNDVRPDRVTSWPLDVQLVPSAILKGKILEAATGALITDEAGAKLSDPHLPRAVLTLTAQNGLVQSILAEADGSYSFDTNLDNGSYELKAERFGFAPWLKRLNLIAGQKLELNVPLEPAKPAPRTR